MPDAARGREVGQLPIALGFEPMYDSGYNLNRTGDAGVTSTHAALTGATVVAAATAHTILDGITKDRKPSTRGERSFLFVGGW